MPNLTPGWLGRLLVATVVLALDAPAAQRARGQQGRPPVPAPSQELARLQIGVPPRLVVGRVGAIEVTVRIAGADRQPLLVTPSVEGEAVRVVRGRLLRDDAARSEGTTLTFALPLSARRPGAALLRVSLLTYVCDTSCRELRADASRMLHVSER
jgi:hypothetical protein